MKKSIDLSDRLSPQSIALLNELAEMGLYGLDVEEVAVRFIDKELVRLCQTGMVEIKRTRRRREIKDY